MAIPFPMEDAMLKKFLMTTLAATALMGASAQAAPARALSLARVSADVRAASAPGKANGLFGLGATGTLAGVLAAMLGIWGIVELADDDAPTSP
ncbi:hypothetical protein ABS767_10370 [Sphingomonas sp. ST-64]|uniref:Uncharacterized protein n=1 Tax=Sphingomonas plantiphila TaxID=3163295 RepID=A0ABW8YMX6_9SPHN